MRDGVGVGILRSEMDLQSPSRTALPPPASRESALSSSPPLSAAIAQEICDDVALVDRHRREAPYFRLSSLQKRTAAISINHRLTLETHSGCAFKLPRLSSGLCAPSE